MYKLLVQNQKVAVSDKYDELQEYMADLIGIYRVEDMKITF